MKRLVAIIAIGAFATLAIVETIHEFISNDRIQYFSKQPTQLFLVAAIGIACGLFAVGFSGLSGRLQRGARLVALASGGGFVTLAGAYFTFLFAGLPQEVASAIPRHPPLIILGCSVVLSPTFRAG